MANVECGMTTGAFRRTDGKMSLHRLLMSLTLNHSSFLILVSSFAAEPRLLVHYMPWFATKDASGAWGWHWTMNHFDPEQMKWDDQRKIASHDHPLIGSYDSGDDQALECQALPMKIAALDGVLIDWYGTSGLNDHAMNHRISRNRLREPTWQRQLAIHRLANAGSRQGSLLGGFLRCQKPSQIAGQETPLSGCRAGVLCRITLHPLI